MKKIALCVLTYNHPNVIEDVLSRCIEDYYRYGIDIYYYDSSETDDTKRIIDRFILQGYDNLYYIKVNCGYDEKIDLVYTGYGLQKEYDYIWPAKDRSFCSAHTLSKVKEAMKEGHDFILIGVAPDVAVSSMTYSEVKEFYRDWGIVATSLDALIYKQDSVLKNYDPVKFAQQYPDEYISAWHVYVYIFNKVLEIDNYSIKVLTGEEILMYNSSLGGSGWIKEIFMLWKDWWVQANDELPDYYDEYKDWVIKAAASWPWIFGGMERLQELHDMGILVSDKMEEIEKNWDRVSDIPIEKVRKIAAGECGYYRDIALLLNTEDEVVNLLARLHKMLDEEQIKVEEIPIDNIMLIIKNKFKSIYESKCNFEDVFEGMLNDISSSVKKTVDKEDVCKMVRHLIVTMALMNR